MGNQLTVVGWVGQKAMAVSFGGTGQRSGQGQNCRRWVTCSKDEMIIWGAGDAWNGHGECVNKGGNEGFEVVIVGGLASKKYNKEKME